MLYKSKFAGDFKMMKYRRIEATDDERIAKIIRANLEKLNLDDSTKGKGYGKELMKIYEVQERNSCLLNVLLNVWEDSVRATHLFLSDAEINKIKGYVPQALSSVEHLIIAEGETCGAVGFMGVCNNRLEMLFISPKARDFNIVCCAG